MVLYKRKLVEFVPHPDNIASFGDHIVWEIKETGELFFYYEEYLERRDFYLQKIFTCESTGRSGVDFFSALESEQNRNQQLSTSFPVPLRKHVLKHVQFSTVSRLEQLVNEVHDVFKNDFYPKEYVLCTRENGDRLIGQVREKVSFGETLDIDGTVLAPFSKYTVSLRTDGLTREDAIFHTGGLSRERRNFSKVLLRDFLKSSLTKEAWHGAPWTVKEHLAKEFGLPIEVPIHLQQSTRIAEKKALAQQKKAQAEFQRQQAEQSMLTISDFRQWPHVRKNGNSLVPSGPPTANQPWKITGKNKNRFIVVPQGSGESLQFNPADASSVQYSPNGTPSFVFYPDGQDSEAVYLTFPPGALNGQVMFTPPVPIKYPIEDLDVPPKPDDLRRPNFKLFTDLPCAGAEYGGSSGAGRYSEGSIGPLLEVWNTLNVHDEVYLLDSFTLDDFAQALRFASFDIECELLGEVHCAVLKQFVDEQGMLLVDLPKFEEDSSESEEEESEAEGEPEPEPEPLRRTTRSSMAKAEALARPRSPSLVDPMAHRGEAFFANFSWQERCKERDFGHNRWQPILAGLLYQLSLLDSMRDRCKKILCKLLPPELEPSEETIIDEYLHLGVGDRLDALQLIVMLSLQTKAIRDQLESMSSEMTRLRKTKIERQRLKKDLFDQLHELDANRKTLRAELEPEVPPEVPKHELNSEATVPEANDQRNDSAGSDEDGLPVRREGALSKKRKREEESKMEAPKPKPKRGRPPTKKLTEAEIKQRKLDELEETIQAKLSEIRVCEEQIDDVGNDLREADCQRTRCLGRDRFCNRYYWFERNGMPFGGVPESSTAEYGYANGRLWMQGPDDMEREGFLDMSEAEHQKYKDNFGMTILERLEHDEGDTHLHNASHWGYFDSAEALDQLIAWLDERGNREKLLRKELLVWRDSMVACMETLKKHLTPVEDEIEAAVTATPPAHISTRTKTYVDAEDTSWTCLKWHNSLAVRVNGIRHSDSVKRRKVQARKQQVSEKKTKPTKKGK